jgi:hypothetical protein
VANPIPFNALNALILSMFIQGCMQQDSSAVGTVQINANAVASVCPPDTASHAATLAAAWGKPTQMLVWLGSTSLESIQAKGLKLDIYDQYINGVGQNSWINWNSPTGAYIGVVTRDADALGAIPMFTLYQMAALGDKNISGLSDRVLMRQYWDNVRVLFRELKTYNKPVLVNFEPDFWGYAQRAYADPTQHFVEVNSVNPDCINQPNDMTGMGHCLVDMARNMAAQAYIGFPPSLFSDVASTEMSYLRQVGAGNADFMVMQAGDRDAGCFEARYVGESAGCVRSDGPTHTWDASNTTRPNFTSHFALARKHYDYFHLPLLWWQTPMGVPSTTPGGRPGAFRDNKMDYFLNHPQEIVAAGGMGVVFSPGHTSQTTLDTDRGQFKRLSEQYFKTPAALP